MRIIVGILLLLGAYLSFAAAIPTGEWWDRFKWPFVSGAKPFLPLRCCLAEPLKYSLSILGGFAFLFSAMGLFAFFVPTHWWPGLAVNAIFCSTVLYLMYLNRFAFLPFTINAMLLWGILSQGWR